MILLIIFILLFCIGILIALYLLVFNNQDEEPSPPEPPPGEEIEIIEIDGVKIENYVFLNSSLRIPGGPFITTNSNGELMTSLIPSNEWNCKGLRLWSINHENKSLGLDSKPLTTLGSITTFSLYDQNNSNNLQKVFNDNNNIIFFENYTQGYKNIIQGLGVVVYNSTDKVSSVRPTKSNITLESTINLGGNLYFIENLTNASMGTNEYKIDVENYYNLDYIEDKIPIWNSLNRRVISSFGGVLSLNNFSPGDPEVEVVFKQYNSNDNLQNAVVINDTIYFLASQNEGYCYVLNQLNLNLSIELIAKAIPFEEIGEYDESIFIS